MEGDARHVQPVPAQGQTAKEWLGIQPAKKMEPRRIDVMAGQIQPTPEVSVLNMSTLTTN